MSFSFKGLIEISEKDKIGHPFFMYFYSIPSKSSNVAVEWLRILLHIQGVSGSNLGLETGYCD
jgi:hypothetical protein